MNYRIGAFGWLSGPTFQGDGGIANAGLYDQRLALKWVQDNIAKFGGDPKRVSILCSCKIMESVSADENTR
jgi:carboxylesterase type B